jgi:hypothetical protein
MYITFKSKNPLNIVQFENKTSGELINYHNLHSYMYDSTHCIVCWSICKRRKDFCLSVKLQKITHPIRINMMTDMMPWSWYYSHELWCSRFFIIYVIYGHAEIVSSCNFCFGSDPFGSWNLLDMIKTFIKSLSNFSGKNNLEFEPEEKRFTNF